MRRARSCTLSLALAAASCARPEASQLSTPLAPVPAAGAEPSASCPRVERAPRLWSGFLVEVPSEAMVLALDVVVPIQNALGALFCPTALRDCRPAALLSINLADAEAHEAQVGLTVNAGGTLRELPLILRSDDAQHWRADAQSLARYLVACRGGPSITTEAAPD